MSGLRRVALLVGCLVVGAAVFAPLLCRVGADPVYRGDRATQRALADGVQRALDGALSQTSFDTGSALFDGEWLFGTYMMAGAGFAQVALEHPEERAALLPRVSACVDGLLSAPVRAFDAERSGEDPIATLHEAHRGHAAYLGYLGVVLGLERRLDPDNEHAALHDRVAQVLEARLARSPIALIETYPGEVYPVDNLAVFATLALHRETTGAPHPALDAALESLEARYRDPDTRLLIQAVSPADGTPVDRPRGSGTLLGAFFATHIDPALARSLYGAARAHLRRGALGFVWMREYLPEHDDERGDIDSGPIVFGAGLSASGFALAGARASGDAATFRGIHALAHLWGAPGWQGDARVYASGGPLGNAILLAMVTAPRGEP